MAAAQGALLAGIRAGMPILLLGLAMTVAFSYMASPAWVVDLMFSATVACTVVKQATVTRQRWLHSRQAEETCPQCKAVLAPTRGASPFCMTCGAWTKQQPSDVS